MPSQDEVLRLIGEIYDAAVDPGLWPGVVTRLSDAMGAHVSGLGIYDFKAQDGIHVAPRNAPEKLQEWNEYWMTRDSLWRRSAEKPVGAMFRFESFVERDQLERSDVYNEWFQPQGMEMSLLGNVLMEGAASGVMGFFRPRKYGQFGEDDKKLLRILLPHLQRAMQLHIRLSRLEIGRDGSVALFDRFEHGALLVDAAARTLFANRAAESMLAGRGGLRLDGGLLAAARPGDTARLRALIAGTAQDGAGGSLLIERENLPPLVLLVVPLKMETSWPTLERPSAIVFVKDPEAAAKSALAAFAQHFGLTPAQTAMMGEILKGDGVPSAAARLGITTTTARSHLAEIFQKTGAGRQGELIRLALQWQERMSAGRP